MQTHKNANPGRGHLHIKMVCMANTRKLWKIDLYFKKNHLNMTLKMGTGFEAWAVHPHPNQIWVPPGMYTEYLIGM